ncbi:hypothetical protein XENOCAPTIV_028061, partial [Xenoophorus captivus]
YQCGSVRHVPSLDSISCAVDGLHLQVTNLCSAHTETHKIIFYLALHGQKLLVPPVEMFYWTFIFKAVLFYLLRV